MAFLLAAGLLMAGCVIVIPISAPAEKESAEEETLLAGSPSPAAVSDQEQITIPVPEDSPASASASPAELPPAVLEAAATEESSPDPQDATLGLPESAPIPTAETAANGALADDLYSFQVMLNGQVYSLPCSYSQLAAAGWAPSEGYSLTLNPNQSALERVSMGAQSIYIRFVNTAMDVLSYQDCNVGGLIVEDTDALNGVQIIMPKGITLGSSYDEVVAAYGSPSRENTTEMTIFMDYRSDTYAEVSFKLDAATRAVKSIDVKNYFGATAAASAAETAPASVAAPASLAQYQAPVQMGENWEDFVVRYGGALYHLPAPIQSFLDNGWVLQSDGSQTVAAKRSAVGVELRLDNQVLRTSVRNYDSVGQPVSNCYVTELKSSIYGPSVALELPQGISEQSTIDQIRSAYGEPTDASSSSSFDYYNYGKIGSRIEISINKENGTITTLTVDCSPSELS